MIKITFCSLSFRSMLISLILVSFWFILPYSVVIPPRSGVIRFYSRVSPPCSGIFRFILVYSTIFVCHSASLRCHSGSFWYIPVPFLFIPSHSGVIPPLPAYSVPFLCLVMPDFTLSNATLGTETERINLNST